LLWNGAEDLLVAHLCEEELELNAIDVIAMDIGLEIVPSSKGTTIKPDGILVQDHHPGGVADTAIAEVVVHLEVVMVGDEELLAKCALQATIDQSDQRGHLRIAHVLDQEVLRSPNQNVNLPDEVTVSL